MEWPKTYLTGLKVLEKGWTPAHLTNMGLLVVSTILSASSGDASLQHVVLGDLSVKQNPLNSGWFVVSKRSAIHTLFHEPCIFSPVATRILPVEIAMKRSYKVEALEDNSIPHYQRYSMQVSITFNGSWL